MKTFLQNHGKLTILILLSSISYYWFANYLNRKDFNDIIIFFGIPFSVYFYVLKWEKFENQQFFQGLAIFFRILFLFSIPPLSDDYFRFIWDGQLIANGLNPFDWLPNEVTIDFPNKAELLAGMNSPNYYTVYPPIAQLIYFLSAWISPKSIFGSILVIRSTILLAEIGTIVLLPKLLQLLKMNPLNSLWYILNPLVIVELVGNLHFEGIMIFFFLLALYLLVLKKEKIAALPWAFAAAVKLIPIFFLPILIRQLRLKKGLTFYVLFTLIFLSLWALFFNQTIVTHFLQSINLYYKTFEFNASIYYIIRWIGFQYYGYNVIQSVGPWMSKIAWFGLLFFQLRKKSTNWNNFFITLLFALTFYYAFALIIHPWYICFLLFFAVFTPFRFAILWSATAIFSYWAYSNANYQENYSLIAFEYLAVLTFMIYEIFLIKRNS